MIQFYKYQGAGNDFILVDQRAQSWISREDQSWIERACDRRFGIGADGLILLQSKMGYDFEMVYFNSDGRESSMCGNGGRCIAAFASDLGIFTERCRFWAIDGEHEAILRQTQSPHLAWVELKMSDVSSISIDANTAVLNTGSPHYVRFEADVEPLDMVAEGRKIRYSEAFRAVGINVNLVSEAKENDQDLRIRTYERGVEDETLACGTGVTAAALAWHRYKKLPAGHHHLRIRASGGELAVRFDATENQTFTNIWLCGPAASVFSGKIDHP